MGIGNVDNDKVILKDIIKDENIKISIGDIVDRKVLFTIANIFRLSSHKHLVYVDINVEEGF